ncbi:MAG TPA: type I phosphomannose isomerase catalytic subunit [Terracidiphilus sp.]|nr:type I phosphomannose isomerase catalytic subunit [Terracidiphilus sp.]
MTAAIQTLSRQITPFRIEPKFDVRVWGYRDLRPWFDVKAETDPIGEAWLTGDMCLVATGPYAGKRLDEVFREAHDAMLGAGVPSPDSPLLIKVIFAQQKLSVQVHPDDAMAQKYGDPRGKTECWYALAAEPGAEVAVGLKPGVTIARVEEGIHKGTLEASLNTLSVAQGDMIFVDAGTVHAIWPGAILLETQQNCDLTYRMFDYGRPRELHIEKSLEATKLSTRAGKVQPKVLADRTVLIDAEYFRVDRIPVDGRRASESLSGAGVAGEAGPVRGLAYLFAATGAGRISGKNFEPVDLPARGIVAVPATAPAFVVEDIGGLDLIRITPNWPGVAR